ncbi:MAG: BamA/TamA family outer membrane protein [Rikenellaceae bacterium]|nr:BamA/TamA family outer membrane protein [Rikenellaceae bacterium]
MRMKNKITLVAAVITVFYIISGCSTTKRIPEGEILYTGVKKIKINDSLAGDVPKSVISDVKAPLSVKPNNPLYSPYIRTPLPIGLWAWNYLYTTKQKGLKHWLYNRLAKEPVLISDVQPEVRLRVVSQILDNNGYFRSTASYEQIPGKNNPKKARLSYFVNIPEPFYLDSVFYLRADGDIGKIIDSMRQRSSIKPGMQYNLDTLANERVKITNVLRNNGYYYFRSDYIEYLADTTRGDKTVELKMRFNSGTPEEVLRTYDIGDINIAVVNYTSGGDLDTVIYDGLTIKYERPRRIRPRILSEAVNIQKGDKYTLNAQTKTQNDLNSLGVFRYVNLNIVPLDSIGESNLLDVNITAEMDQPLQAQFEADVYSKSNSFVGPGAIFSVRHNNIFKGAEVLSVRLTGSYEWQTGNRRQIEGESKLINSYEFGITASLNIPRFTPRMFNRLTYPTGTVFQLGADILNRPGYFRMLSLNGSANYNFQTSPYSFHTVTAFKLVYTKLLNSTDSFNQTMDQNPAIALSFRDQLIPSIGYTYTYDRIFGQRQRNRVFWQTSVTSAGNIIYGVSSLFGAKGSDRKIFGVEYSQFMKLTTEFRHYHKIGEKNTLAARFIAGIGYAYANSTVLPYSEQFYIGGANSIRAFTIRSIGPGSYKPADENESLSYLDQTGDFKLEGNIEFRFAIMGKLNGAVFMDAGNIWLLRNDPLRPGAQLRAKGFFNEIALGTGAGLRYDISYLVIRADLGIGLHTPYSNPDNGGYFNTPSFRNDIGFHLAIGYPF